MTTTLAACVSCFGRWSIIRTERILKSNDMTLTITWKWIPLMVLAGIMIWLADQIRNNRYPIFEAIGILICFLLIIIVLLLPW